MPSQLFPNWLQFFTKSTPRGVKIYQYILLIIIDNLFKILSNNNFYRALTLCLVLGSYIRLFLSRINIVNPLSNNFNCQIIRIYWLVVPFAFLRIDSSQHRILIQRNLQIIRKHYLKVILRPGKSKQKLLSLVFCCSLFVNLHELFILILFGSEQYQAIWKLLKHSSIFSLCKLKIYREHILFYPKGQRVLILRPHICINMTVKGPYKQNTGLGGKEVISTPDVLGVIELYAVHVHLIQRKLQVHVLEQLLGCLADINHNVLIYFYPVFQLRAGDFQGGGGNLLLYPAHNPLCGHFPIEIVPCVVRPPLEFGVCVYLLLLTNLLLFHTIYFRQRCLYILLYQHQCCFFVNWF